MDDRPPGQDLVARPGLRELARAASIYAQASKAESTRRAYASDWTDFSTWCDDRGAEALPANPAVVALYLTERAGALTVSTLARRLAAIRAHHKAKDQPEPRSAALDDVWAGIRRTHARPPKKKRAMGMKVLQRVVRTMPPGLKGLRDTAIVLVGFGMAGRRSEISRLDLAGPGAGDVRVSFVEDGLEIAIDKSKADQEGRGATLGIPFGSKLCAVLALKAWIAAADIQEGSAVFRQMRRSGQVLEDRMSGAAIAAVIQEAAGRVGLTPAEFGGHSLRRGLITDAIAKGVGAEKVMRQSRHARFDTMRAYIEDGERFKNNAAGKLM